MNDMATPSNKKLLKAKASLVLDFPFFGMLALRLKYKAAPGVGSAGVDGKTLFYEPGFVDALGIPDLTGLLAHEIMHVALGHHVRRYNRDHKKWNYACDFAIDPMIKASGLTLPNITFMGKQYLEHIDPKFAGMGADHIYTLLEDPPPDAGGAGDVFDSPCISDGTNNSPDDKSEGQSLTHAQYETAAHKEELDWRIATQQAAMVAKQAGKLPGALEELIEKINKPKINWIAVLRTFMTEIRKDDYDWSRPNRRHICNNIYFPTLRSEGMGEIVIAVDTSGSISKAELEQFSGELNSILGDVKPSKVHVIYCDAAIQGTPEEFEPDDFPVKLHKKGGGGTDFTEPFEWMLDNVPNPAAFVYLTDLYGPCRASEPMCPVLWVCTSEQDDIPFGQLLPLEITPDVDYL